MDCFAFSRNDKLIRYCEKKRSNPWSAVFKNMFGYLGLVVSKKAFHISKKTLEKKILFKILIAVGSVSE